MDISQATTDYLLALRLCDLPITIQGTWVEDCVAQLYRELVEKGLVHFQPPCYLADEWLTPDQEPVIGIPFYLAHSRLMQLEQEMMLEVEGGTHEWCMKLLRHEAGHAINYAYRLFKKRSWQKMFGLMSDAYEDSYRFRPYSKNYVRHLDNYYAQCHPDEDFAETFAVWLLPESNWRAEYQGWKALEKLQYVDALMNTIKKEAPPVDKGKRYWDIRKLRMTLKKHYQKKRNEYCEQFPDFHDAQLLKIFAPCSGEAGTDLRKRSMPSSAQFIRTYRAPIIRSVAQWTGEKNYLIDSVIDRIYERCRVLKLCVQGNESIMIADLVSYITTLVMNNLYTGKYRGEKWRNR